MRNPQRRVVTHVLVALRQGIDLTKWSRRSIARDFRIKATDLEGALRAAEEVREGAAGGAEAGDGEEDEHDDEEEGDDDSAEEEEVEEEAEADEDEDEGAGEEDEEAVGGNGRHRMTAAGHASRGEKRSGAGLLPSSKRVRRR